MISTVIEAEYPIHFRRVEAEMLGEHIRLRHSVDLVGMKRVGISNFLRFFLYHHDIVPTYINEYENHLFIPVDLNDLVEREIYPFWVLTFKRIIDNAPKANLSKETIETVEELFLTAIQSQEVFLVMDGIRKALVLLVQEGILPTLFFLRFDRMRESVPPSFFDNLQGLAAATHHRMCYVFTSFRTLDVLAPNVFTKPSLSAFAHTMYLPCATENDMTIIYQSYKDHYTFTLSVELQKELFRLVGGYVRYLHLSLFLLHEKKETTQTKEELFTLLTYDERVYLQSEEIWESFTSEEQEVVRKVLKKEAITLEEKRKGKYVWETGTITKNKDIFSPLFAYYLSHKDEDLSEVEFAHFSRKENSLFLLLKDHVGEICERELIIEAVWPEAKETGVSDWAIDRLIARVREKMSKQESPYEVKTVRTRGYQLVAKA